ncbi:ATP-binding protein [Campylobacter sp. MIT 99-7217]|uniref:HP0729 family protein n=1 Tax=Campylobacter sp. MIT 99-7217 TaxID=535091 RepID=UPI0011586C9B|nr:HP0729 family protein [Campylobacter sp. MIT 99-7217]TQR33134.1 ATP-binding protein [Campylobacter sp. MIT 99-7217]
MKSKEDLLILYNPYYEKDVIKAHLEVLKDKKKVAFGKVKSKLKDQNSPFEKDLQRLYQGVNEQNYLQLFLSDYANLFVAKVIRVQKEPADELLPSYYEQKKLEVEDFFIIEDLRELVRENFSLLRDEFLSNFLTPNDHTYAIYGNNYTYPLIVRQKNYKAYFQSDEVHFLNIYKSEDYLRIGQIFVDYVFGSFYYKLHHDSISNLISAQLELEQNEANKLYDYTSVVVKYSKALEYEIYDFSRAIFARLCKANKELLNISYSVQERSFILENFFTQKPNLGTVKFLFLKKELFDPLEKPLKNFVIKLKDDISFLQNIRNASVHKDFASLEQARALRAKILGLYEPSLLKKLIFYKEKYGQGL